MTSEQNIKRIAIFGSTGSIGTQALDVIAANPVTIQLRYLQTLSEIATEKNSTIVFPLPLDMLNLMLNRKSGEGQ